MERNFCSEALADCGTALHGTEKGDATVDDAHHRQMQQLCKSFGHIAVQAPRSASAPAAWILKKYF